MRLNSKTSFLYLAIALLAFGLSLAYSLALGISRPHTPDGIFYLELAKTLVEGRGYINTSGAWANQPTMGRTPAWPVFVVVFLKLFSFLDANSVIRICGALCNALSAVLLVWVSQKLFSKTKVSLVAGVLFACFPSAIYFMDHGLSEVFFAALTLGAIALAIRTERSVYTATFLLSIAVLVRSNFILLAGAWGAVLLFFYLLKSKSLPLGVVRKSVVCFLIFIALPSLWLLRNYQVSGHFPVFSTIRGETFYGAYNDIASKTFRAWGYWVFPDEIPGETPKRALMQRMKSEKELDDYYFSKGMSWLQNNYSSMPRLFLGRLVRAYVPIPWVPDMAAYAASAYRALIYFGFIYAVFFCRPRVDVYFELLTLSMILVNFATVLVFYGCARFAFSIEPLLIPHAAFGLVRFFEVRRGARLRGV